MSPSAAQAVRDARKARNLTQTDVATASGVSTSTICRLEAGLLPKYRALAAIARTLELPIEQLLEAS